jgi:single-stranded-DNA-specific exonuclease
MDAAVARVADAVQAGKKIAIFGDYDVDGATSSAVLCKIPPVPWDWTLSFTFRTGSSKGTGRTDRRSSNCMQDGAELLVTLDCGSTSFEAFETAHGNSISMWW